MCVSSHHIRRFFSLIPSRHDPTASNTPGIRSQVTFVWGSRHKRGKQGIGHSGEGIGQRRRKQQPGQIKGNQRLFDQVNNNNSHLKSCNDYGYFNWIPVGSYHDSTRTRGVRIRWRKQFIPTLRTVQD